MAAEYHRIDLSGLALSPGQGRRLHREVRPGALQLGGQRYDPVPAAVPMLLEISRTASGHAFHLTFASRLEGPCMRCLEEATVEVDVDSREVHQPSGGDEDLESPYVDGDQLDLAAWAHDALVLAAPAQLLCRPECLGLCPICGEPLNDAESADHRHGEQQDSPWAALDELRDRG
jgi:DUF177 domain-containing protein